MCLKVFIILRSPFSFMLFTLLLLLFTIIAVILRSEFTGDFPLSFKEKSLPPLKDYYVLAATTVLN